MTPAEIGAVSRLGGHAFAGLVLRIEQVHQTIAGRVFAAAGPVRAPVQAIHDSITCGVYLALRGAGSAAGVLGGKAVALLGAGGQPAGSESAGNLALAALNAVAGEQLGADLAPLAIRMAVRAGGRDVDMTARELSAVFAHPAPRLAVFVHGLAETEESWQRRGAGSGPYGPRLQAEFS